jgi:hypothetical protein
VDLQYRRDGGGLLFSSFTWCRFMAAASLLRISRLTDEPEPWRALALRLMEHVRAKLWNERRPGARAGGRLQPPGHHAAVVDRGGGVGGRAARRDDSTQVERTRDEVLPEPPPAVGSRPAEAANCFREFRAPTRASMTRSTPTCWRWRTPTSTPSWWRSAPAATAEDVHRLVSGRLKHWGFAAAMSGYISRSAFMRYDTQALVVAETERSCWWFFAAAKIRSASVDAVTATLRDWLATDADMALATSFSPTSGPTWRCTAASMRGFMAVAEEIETCGGCARGQAGRRLWVTGHSMGGALATLAAPWLCARDLPVAGVYTFGAPMAGGVGFTNLFRTLPIRGFHRYVVEDDAVPRLPPEPLKYQHVGPAFLIGEDGSVVLRDEDPRGVPSLVKHPPQVYCEALSRALTDEQRRLLPPPPEP